MSNKCLRKKAEQTCYSGRSSPAHVLNQQETLMHTIDTLTQFLTVLNSNHFAALVLLMLVSINNGRPPKR